jgi:hypothetical protein
VLVGSMGDHGRGVGSAGSTPDVMDGCGEAGPDSPPVSPLTS